jgi:hypothetical protein
MNKTLLIIFAFVAVSTLIVSFSMSKGKTFVSTEQDQQRTALPSEQSAPLLQQEDVLRTFFNLIDEGRASEAVGMMTNGITADDSQKQAWGVEFNAFESVKVVDISPSSENTYKVIINVVMKPESANAVIPYYGFYNGDNTRWVGLEKEGNLWKITDLATGP